MNDVERDIQKALGTLCRYRVSILGLNGGGHSLWFVDAVSEDDAEDCARRALVNEVPVSSEWLDAASYAITNLGPA